MRRSRVFLLLAGGALIGAPLLIWTVSSILSRPVNWPVPAAPAPAQEVRLRTADAVLIAGSYWPGSVPGGPAVLLLHGINNDRTSLRAHARWLHELGYAVLAIDLRGHGGSGAETRTFGWRESADARAAFRFLKSGAPDRRIGVIGVSLGGAAALTGPDGPLPADALVLHAVYPDLRTAIRNRLERSGSAWIAAWSEPLLSYQTLPRYHVHPDAIAPAKGLRRFRGAALIIGGADDLDSRAADSQRLFQAAAGPRSLWMVGGANHVETSKLWNEAYRERVGRLFAQYLAQPARR